MHQKRPQNNVGVHGGLRGIRADHRPRPLRIAEIRKMLDEGYTVKQIAAQQAVTESHVSELIKAGGLKVKIDRVLLPQARRVIEETVTAVGAMSRGLELVNGAELDFTAEEAAELLAELKSALVTLYQLSRSLKEIKESNHGSQAERESRAN